MTRLLGLLGSRVSRELAVFVAGFSIVLGVVLVVFSFATVEQRVTRFGTALMPDFAAMYVAGKVLNEHSAERLYDFPLQESVRRAEFPLAPSTERLPYVYAPWWAVVWKPFAAFPYETAAALWLVASLGLMAGAFACLARAFPELPRRDFALVAIVALSFEPFLFECWANGQVSSFPFFCLSAALMLERSGRPVAAGMMLALLTYKPMQPPLLFALLAIGARWRTLGGIAAGGAVLGAVSMALFGPGILLEYPQRLVEYGNLVAPDNGTGAQLRFWKYTDLQTAARLLGPPLETPMRIAAVPVAIWFVISLARLWRRSGASWAPETRHAWAATLVLLPVLNFYYAVYDMLLAIPGVLLAATLLDRGARGGAAAQDDGDARADDRSARARIEQGLVLPDWFYGAVALVYLAGLLSPTFEVIRVNLMTVSLLVLGSLVLLRVRPVAAR